MPFANKFRAMMDLPFPGDSIGAFEVERVDVVDLGSDWRGYRYGVEMVLHGIGGKEGVRRTVAPVLAQRVTTFSGYGNPYQLWFGRPLIESLGERRYAIRVEGAGSRIELHDELDRFTAHLEAEGLIQPSSAASSLGSYLDEYRVDVERRVDRYRRSLRRRNAP